MRSSGINVEGEFRGQPANPGSPGKMAIKKECVTTLGIKIRISMPNFIEIWWAAAQFQSGSHLPCWILKFAILVTSPVWFCFLLLNFTLPGKLINNQMNAALIRSQLNKKTVVQISPSICQLRNTRHIVYFYHYYCTFRFCLTGLFFQRSFIPVKYPKEKSLGIACEIAKCPSLT